MIERHVTFDVLPGREAEFESFVEGRYAPAMASQQGFEGLRLLREAEAPRRYQMVIRFQSAAGARAWCESDQHKSLSPLLKGLHGGSEVVVYDVVAER